MPYEVTKTSQPEVLLLKPWSGPAINIRWPLTEASMMSKKDVSAKPIFGVDIYA
jgi:dTDP-4-dehydrorhamnose 3,5-epimerase-like enzyme